MRLAFQPNHGKLLATASMDGSVRLWDVETGTQVRQFGDGKSVYNTVAWSPDGSRLAATCDVQEKQQSVNQVTIWPVGGGKATWFTDPIDWIESLVWSPDGKWLAGASSSREHLQSRLWDAATGDFVCAFTGHTHPILSAAFSALSLSATLAHSLSLARS